MDINISLSILRNFMKFFSSKKINEIAVNVGFRKRIGKLESVTFVKTFVIGTLNKANITVQDISTKCADTTFL